jgi:hypothetical protein
MRERPGVEMYKCSFNSTDYVSISSTSNWNLGRRRNLKIILPLLSLKSLLHKRVDDDMGLVTYIANDTRLVIMYTPLCEQWLDHTLSFLHIMIYRVRVKACFHTVSQGQIMMWSVNSWYVRSESLKLQSSSLKKEEFRVKFVNLWEQDTGQ